MALDLPPLSGGRLAACMLENGPSCSRDADSFAGVLARSNAEVDEESVAQALGVLARGSQGGETWDVGVVMNTLRGSRPGLDWMRVAEHLDHEGFAVADARGFGALCSGYSLGAGKQLPVSAVVGRCWRNAAGQLSLLLQATQASPDVYSFEGVENKLEGMPTGTPNHAWLCR